MRDSSRLTHSFTLVPENPSGLAPPDPEDDSPDAWRFFTALLLEEVVDAISYDSEE